MADEGKSLWVGNLDQKVTDEILFELFLQAGPIERLILPADGEGDNKKHKGHAYVLFRHSDSVEYASQILDGSALFGQLMSLKAQSLPAMFKTMTHGSNRGRHDNSYRPGFNKATTWHGQKDFTSRGRGNFTSRGGVSSNYAQNSSFNNYQSQDSTGFWNAGSGQQSTADSQGTLYGTTDNSMGEKRQRLLQQQNVTVDAHRQVQQGTGPSQAYGVTPQQQGMWNNNVYSSNSWNMTGGDTTGYQSYTDQYSNWYQQQ